MEQILNVNEQVAADEDDNALLSLLVLDKIESFKSKIPKMEMKFEKIYESIKLKVSGNNKSS